MGLAFGSYLKTPITEKISNDESNDKLKTAASSMQGWRVSQEDAHNCLLEFDANASLFAVYDGHGGHEVAEYCALKLPEYIKQTEAYKNKDFEKALIDAFLGLDAAIDTPEVVEVLKEISKAKEENDRENESDSDSDLEENVSNLREEATMPIEEVIEKYKASLKHPLHNLRKDGENVPVSPFLRAPKDSAATEACSSSSTKDLKPEADSTTAAGSSASSECDMKPAESSTNAAENETETPNAEKNGPLETPKIHIESVDDPTEENKSNEKESAEVTGKSSEVDNGAGDGQSNQNGKMESATKEKTEELETPVNEKQEGDEELPPQENGEVGKKGKGKATTKTKGVPPRTRAKRIRPIRTAQQLYNRLLQFESESDESEEDEDETFQEPDEETSSEDDISASILDVDNSDSTSEEGEESDDEDDDDDDDGDEEEDIEDEEDDETDENEEFGRSMTDKPGSESGCTAVVALLHDNQLFVANAGDSRCIVCRNGQAIEMSIDHKPEDKEEYVRITKAGGSVWDGRVNGGLNLSRAIGDHHYKQNKDLSDREQMITALPDVRKLSINPGEDEFMVLACDGIWNSMTSQQVVDFVRPKIQENQEKLSKICEEMFEHCLASDTLGDGTGCDNMTAIIVQFKSNLCKRAAPCDDMEESGKLKRAKTDDSVSQTETATA